MSEVTEKAKLFLLIQGKYYLCERIKFEGERRETVGWKLTKVNDKLAHSPYCVIRQPSGRITCECADFMFVRQKPKTKEEKEKAEKEGESINYCKHISSLVEIFGPSLRGI